MRKVIISLLLAASTLSLVAQEEGLTWGMQTSSTTKSDEQIKDAEKAAKPATWVERARIYTNLYEFDVKSLGYGMKESDINLVKGAIPTKRTEDKLEILSFERVDIYMKDAKLVRWVYTDDIRKSRPEPLYTAYEAYMKALSLDVEGKLGKKLKDKLEKLTDYYHLYSIALFYNDLNDYKTSLKYFEAIQAINDLPAINKLDSNILINCGVIAMKAKEMETAKKYFNKAAQLKVGGVDLYIDIYRIYMDAGDTTGAISTLKEGIEKYPKSANMLVEMVNLYLKTGKNKEAVDYLTKAIELEPQNPVYYFALGTLYDQLKDQEKAIATYQKAVDIDPNYVDAYLNMGASYYNTGIEHFKIASDTKDNAVYEKEIGIAKGLYEKAIPYLIKVKEKSTEKKYKLDALFSLKQIYYKLGQKENSDKAKAEYDALSK